MRKISVVALIGMVAAVSVARSDIIPSFAGTSPGSGTNTVWGYQISIASGTQVTAGDFFTIYDFGPFITGSNTQPSGWSFSFSLITTPPNGTKPPDSPTAENLTWTYTGSTPISAALNIGPFSVAVATSQFQQLPQTQNGYFAAQATRVPGENGGTKINNVGQIPVPVPIPEPTTLSLLALAGAGAVLKAIRRRK